MNHGRSPHTLELSAGRIVNDAADRVAITLNSCTATALRSSGVLATNPPTASTSRVPCAWSAAIPYSRARSGACASIATVAIAPLSVVLENPRALDSQWYGVTDP